MKGAITTILLLASLNVSAQCDSACVAQYEQQRDDSFAIIESQSKTIDALEDRISVLNRIFSANQRGRSSIELYNEVIQLRDENAMLKEQSMDLISVRDDLQSVNEALALDLAAANALASDSQAALNTAIAERNAAISQCQDGGPSDLIAITAQINDIHVWTQVRRDELLDEIFRLVMEKNAVIAERDACWIGVGS